MCRVHYPNPSCPTCSYREVVPSKEIWLDSCLVFFRRGKRRCWDSSHDKKDIHAFVEIATLSRRYALERTRRNDFQWNSKNGSFIFRFRYVGCNLASLLDDTRQIQRDSARRSWNIVDRLGLWASNALLAVNCQPHSARASGEHSCDAYDRLFFFFIVRIIS